MIVHCPLALSAARTYAESINDKTLSECLNRLEKYEQNEYDYGHVTANLYKDFCEHSFYFVLERPDGSMMMNGGIILHGTGKETYSVCIDGEPDAPQWRMHT